MSAVDDAVYAGQLKELLKVQKEMLDGANRIILLQQQQMDLLMYRVRMKLHLEDALEKGGAGRSRT